MGNALRGVDVPSGYESWKSEVTPHLVDEAESGWRREGFSGHARTSAQIWQGTIEALVRQTLYSRKEGRTMQVFVLAKNDHLIFNVDAPVGQGGTNALEDVYLVQFLILKAAERATRVGPDLKTRMLRVPLSGKADDATIDGIKAVQEQVQKTFPGAVVDGRVSPALGVNYGGGIWTIVTLNDSVREYYPERWPRLQDLKGCPPVVRIKVLQLL
jgi:hypothetical protein